MSAPPAQRTRELTLGPLLPWHTTITVDAVSTNHGRKSSLPHDHLFEVTAEWHGPPARGFPPSLTAVSGRDVVAVTTLDEARALAHATADAFRAGGDWAPDMRELLGGDRAAFPSHDPAS